MNMMTALQRPDGPPSNDAARRSLRFRKLVSLFERDEIEAGMDALLSYLDARAGDPDLETTGAEDDFMRHAYREGPGCSIADCDASVEDAGLHGSGDVAYAEWDTIGASRRRAGEIDGKPLDAWYGPGSIHEDAEDCDPAGGNVTDDPHDAEEDFGAEDGAVPTYGVDQDGPRMGELAAADTLFAANAA